MIDLYLVVLALNAASLPATVSVGLYEATQPVRLSQKTAVTSSSPGTNTYRLQICSGATNCSVFESRSTTAYPDFHPGYLASVGEGFNYVLASDYVWLACVDGVDTARNRDSFGPGGTFCRFVGGGSSTKFAADGIFAGHVSIGLYKPLTRDRSQFPKGYWSSINIVTSCADGQEECRFDTDRQNAKCNELKLGSIVMPAERRDRPGRSGVVIEEGFRYENAAVREAVKGMPVDGSRWGRSTAEWTIACNADRYFPKL